MSAQDRNAVMLLDTRGSPTDNEFASVLWRAAAACGVLTNAACRIFKQDAHSTALRVAHFLLHNAQWTSGGTTARLTAKQHRNSRTIAQLADPYLLT